jgi:RWP-RK domain
MNLPSQTHSELLNSVRNEFGKPIRIAAKQLNISVTMLRNLCRELGITRWPFKASHSAQNRNQRFDFLLEEPSPTLVFVEQTSDHRITNSISIEQEHKMRKVYHGGEYFQNNNIGKPDRMKTMVSHPTTVRILPSFNELLVHIGLQN